MAIIQQLFSNLVVFKHETDRNRNVFVHDDDWNTTFNLIHVYVQYNLEKKIYLKHIIDEKSIIIIMRFK